MRALADRGLYANALDALDGLAGQSSVEGRLWRGILMLNLGEFRAALDRFRQCVFLEPDDPDLRRWLAAAYQSLGLLREAERGYRNAEELGR